MRGNLILNIMAAKTKKSKIMCVSHREDTDGISSAALIKQAFGGETIILALWMIWSLLEMMNL